MGSTMTYGVRESPKAKRVRLTVSARSGLVVVVPKGFDQTRIPDLLSDRQAWIENALRRANEESQQLKPEPSGGLPQQIHLRAIGEEWTILSQPNEVAGARAVEAGSGSLVVFNNVDDIAACLGALQKWINRKAHQHLAPWLQNLSQEQELPFGRTLVRSQRTRWGSCSRHKTISINQNLLFIPGHLVRYVFLHELCHTVHLNHSKRFWTLVGKREPDYQTLRKELRSAWPSIPTWSSG